MEFTQSLLKLQPELLQFALKLTTDRDDAKDLLQTTFLHALKNQHLFIYETSFRCWLYTLMRNLFINDYRGTIRKRHMLENKYSQDSSASINDDGENCYEMSYDLSEMYRLLNTLPSVYREPFTLYVSGFKYKEIADKMNIPIGTIKSRISAARQKLQLVFKDYA